MDHWFDESYLFVYIEHVCLLVNKNRLKYTHVMRIVRSISNLYKTSSLLLQVETR